MNRAKVLVIDDEPEMSKLVADIVRKQGHSAVSITQAVLAMGMLVSEPFDLVITDLRMPELDGIQLLKRIKEYDPNIAIIAMTAFGSTDTALRAMRAGAFDYLPKPFSPADMALRIENALARRMPVELSVIERTG